MGDNNNNNTDDDGMYGYGKPLLYGVGIGAAVACYYFFFGRQTTEERIKQAVLQEDSKTLKQLLENNDDATVATLYRHDWNLLHWAASSKNNTETLRILLDHPTCTIEVINKKTTPHGNTPLDFAIFESSTAAPTRNDIIKMLKAHGATQNNSL